MRYHITLFLAWALLADTRTASAGMPANLPTEEKIQYVLRLNEPFQARLQAISFFVAAILLCAFLVQRLWNYFRRDFSALPRLSYGRALAGVVLWGLLFVIVLTMISGARELMTPGAWEKQGFTYRLSTPNPIDVEPSVAVRRKQQLERLRTALWHFAATHNGQFPSQAEAKLIPNDLWLIPDAGGLRYLYTPDLSALGPVATLAWEPALDPENRLALRTNGDIGPFVSADAPPSRSTGETP